MASAHCWCAWLTLAHRNTHKGHNRIRARVHSGGPGPSGGPERHPLDERRVAVPFTTASISSSSLPQPPTHPAQPLYPPPGKACAQTQPSTWPRRCWGAAVRSSGTCASGTAAAGPARGAAAPHARKHLGAGVSHERQARVQKGAVAARPRA
jgi:hypothetical protein